MKNILSLILFCIIIISCKKDKSETTPPRIVILEVSKEQVNYYDTITVNYSTTGIDNYQDISVTIDGISAQIISNSDNQITFVVPYGINEGFLFLHYSDGSSSDIYYLTLISWINITSVDPSTGKGGDIIKIKGWGFEQLGNYTQIKINSLPITEFISKNDTLLTCKVPEGCGSGKIRFHLYRDYGTCNSESAYELIYESIHGFFNYQFFNSTGNKYPSSCSINIDSSTQTYVRNPDNTVYKVIYNESQYDLYRYSSENLIDTIYHIYDESITSYVTFVRQLGGSEVTFNFYSSNGSLQFYNKYYYSDNNMVRYEKFDMDRESGELYFAERNTYEYFEDSLSHERMLWNPDGSENLHTVYGGYIDLYNTPVDLGIPGYPTSPEELLIYNSSQTYHNYYNNQGLLVKRVYCGLGLYERCGYTIEYTYD